MLLTDTYTYWLYTHNGDGSFQNLLSSFRLFPITADIHLSMAYGVGCRELSIFNNVCLKGKNTLLLPFVFKVAVCKQLLLKIVIGTKQICATSVNKCVCLYRKGMGQRKHYVVWCNMNMEGTLCWDWFSFWLNLYSVCMCVQICHCCRNAFRSDDPITKFYIR